MRYIYRESGSITQWYVNYYDSIQFTVKYEVDIYINITLRVGKVIDVEEFDSSKKQSYVLSRAIITHQDDFTNIDSFILIN